MLNFQHIPCKHISRSPGLPNGTVIAQVHRHILVYIMKTGVHFMKKSIPYWQMGGFIFTAVAGTLLHFLFDWTSGNVVTALFSAVNESIWEHLKLLFYPMVIVAMIQYCIWGKTTDSFWCIKLIGILVGLVLIPTVYYTYTGILGMKADWFNIAIFFLAAGVVYWIETKLFQLGYTCRNPSKLAVMLIFLIAAAFMILTFLPPHIPFFEDPITGSYGFQR